MHGDGQSLLLVGAAPVGWICLQFPHLIDRGPVYAVRQFLHSHRRGWGMQYLVEWRGHGSEECSLVPAQFIICPQLIRDFLYLNRDQSSVWARGRPPAGSSAASLWMTALRWMFCLICLHQWTLRWLPESRRSSSFPLPWLHFPWPGPASGTTGVVPRRVVPSLPALLLSWKIPLNLPWPLFHTHLIGLDHFHLLLSQATAVRFVADSSTFFIWIYWFYPACLGHSFFISALVNPTTVCPWLSLCIYSDLCLAVAVRDFLPSLILFSASYQ